MTVSPNPTLMIDPIDEESVSHTDNMKALEVVVETSHIVVTNDTPLDPSIANTPLTSPGADAAAGAALVLPSELAGSADFGSVRPTVTALDHIRATLS
ncbi:hypothetical protein BN946_scf184911.g62 [Trametes cinnabarina]|uniref:Uncharacterized protein n=1 Tax=Pycnoporus cinnabarinus TaxID=5643 RepID=A0A060SAQ4_PYCCI|nr:hypothetical protein BN946_scf184911.g62 [Trametes cinnabarina]